MNCRTQLSRLFTRQFSANAQKPFRILGVETSCDDSSICVLECYQNSPPKVLIHKSDSCLSRNERHGGIHPIETGHFQEETTPKLLSSVLEQIQNQKLNIDLVAATEGPGMKASLTHGYNIAKGCALALKIPFIGVHHMQAHALTARMTPESFMTPFPYFSLLTSGGHTQLVESKSLIDHKVVVDTDCSIGVLFDKVAREMNLTWNGQMPGARLESWAFGSKPIMQKQDFNLHITEPCLKSADNPQFSISGIYNQAMSLVSQTKEEKALKSAGRLIQYMAFKHVIRQVSRYILSIGASNARHPVTVVCGGGVASNSLFRTMMSNVVVSVEGGESIMVLPNNKRAKFIPVFPPKDLCRDNSIMIAWTGFEMYKLGYRSPIDVKARAVWPLTELVKDYIKT